MRRVSTVLLAMLLLCACIPWASAAKEEPIQPMWDYVTLVDGSISISSAGTAKVSATGSAERKGVTKMMVTASLQQLKGKTWTEVKSWTVSDSGTSIELTEKSWPVAHGYSYRLVVTAKAYKNTTLLETGTYTASYGYFK